MTHENINIQYPNFCLSPQGGTICTIDTTNPDTILRVKATAGNIISDYTLSSNITNEVLAVEYAGPVNLSGFLDGVTFFTLEKQDSTTCIIKRWEINVDFATLDLKQQLIKTTYNNIYYDATGMAVEHYRRTFTSVLPPDRSYLDISSALRIVPGDVLFLGPSTHPDYDGVSEKATVINVVGTRIYLNRPSIYQYTFGDNITFFNNIYIVSALGYAGDDRYGNLIKMDAYSGLVSEYANRGDYKNITGARWSIATDAVAGIMVSQLVFIRPYDGYLKWRSMFMYNIQDGDGDYFEIYDIVFDEATVYRLALYTNRKEDNGQITTYSWTNYNYQQDTLLPYTQSIAIYTDKQYIIGSGFTFIRAQARDQFGVGLRDVNLDFYKEGGDAGAEFTPLNGRALTDSNGEAYMKYTISRVYEGASEITLRADKSSSLTGSQYCWDNLILFSEVTTEIILGKNDGGVFQYYDVAGQGRTYQLETPYQVDNAAREEHAAEREVPAAFIFCRSYFGTPMGNWIFGGEYKEYYMPWFQTTPPRTDGPALYGGPTWDCVGYDATDPQEPNPAKCAPTALSPKVHFIKQILEFTQIGVPNDYYLTGTPLEDDAKAMIIPQPKWYWIYKDAPNDAELEEGHPVYNYARQIEEAVHDLQMSQLHLSKHTHYVDGDPYDTLFTNVRLDQFIFVEDAVPKFWSYKNPTETNIWIRMRPFAFSLDGLTLKFFIREIWTEGDKHYDTDYYDVASEGTITYFDAGGGLLGVEFLYNPPQDFHHDAIVYVHIEIYDVAAEPNYIYTDYWFRVIPDFNSPYLVNLNPDREEDQVDVDTNIYFEIKDDGAGIDIDTLEVFLNSRIIYHAGYAEGHPELNLDTTIEKVSNYHYKVTIDIPSDVLYDKMYTVKVQVSDVSPNINMLRDSYRFYTRQSDAPWFTGFDPKLCRRGMPRFTDVSFLVLASENGVDEDTIRIQVHDKDVTDQSKITPIIYRIL